MGERRIRTLSKGSPVCWHIVGHSLADDRLLGLLAEVRLRVPSEHTYRLVDPIATDCECPQAKRLGAELGIATDATPGIELVAKTAAEYMAQLQRGGSPEPGALTTEPPSAFEAAAPLVGPTAAAHGTATKPHSRSK